MNKSKEIKPHAKLRCKFCNNDVDVNSVCENCGAHSCVSPNGRTDGHGLYIESARTPATILWYCSFCGVTIMEVDLKK